MLVITRSFQGYGFSFRPVGSLIDPQGEIREELLRLGVAAELETKVQPVPDFTKKKRLESSRQDQAAPLKTPIS